MLVNKLLMLVSPIKPSTINIGYLQKVDIHVITTQVTKIHSFFGLIHETAPRKCKKKHFRASKNTNFPGGHPSRPLWSRPLAQK